MYQVLLVIYFLIALSLVILIITQQGKSTDMSTTFGVSYTSKLFGIYDPGNFMTRITTVLSVLFFILSLVLGNQSRNHGQKNRERNTFHQLQKVSKKKVEILVK